MKTADRVKGIVDAALARQLRRDGYRRRGNLFRWFGDGMVRMVRVTSRGYAIPPDGGMIGSFDVELGLFFPAFLEVQHKEQPPGSPRIGDMALVVGLSPQLGEDIGLRPERRGRIRWGWFDDLAGTMPDDDAQAVAVHHDWVTYGKPWLEAHSSLEAARDYCCAHGLQIEALFLSLALGDEAQALVQLSACDRSLGGEWREYVTQIARDHGVVLPRRR